MTDKSDTPGGLGADSKVAAHLGVHPKSLPRWDRRPELQFPPPIYINGRRYRRWDQIEEFVRRAAVAHASKLSKA
jgi:hypothetical protein